MRKSAIIAIAIFLILAETSAVRASNSLSWPTFHGNATRTGFSDSTIPSSAKVLWQITVGQLEEWGIGGFNAGSPVIDQDKVFLVGDQIFSVDLRTGKLVWKYKDEKTAFYPYSLAAGDNKIFATINNSGNLKELTAGSVYALDEKTGQLLWKYQTQKSISHSNPLVAAGNVFVGDDSGSVYAIDAKIGKLIWQKTLEAYQIHSSPAYDNGVIYVGTETQDIGGGRTNRGSYLYALSAKDGKTLWQFETDWRSNDMPNLIHGTPAISGEVVYFGSENGWFYALNKNSGEVIWKKIITKETKTSARQAASKSLVGVSTAPALAYDKIFVGTWEGKFLALSQKDGKILWEFPYGKEGTNSSAVVADRKVCLGSHFEYFYCFNEENGKVIWKEKLGGPSAALSYGILIVPSTLTGDGSNNDTGVVFAFSNQGASEAFGPVKTANTSFEKYYPLALVLLIAILLAAVIFWLLKFRRITLKKLLIYGGLPLFAIALGVLVYIYYSRLQWTDLQTQLQKEGKVDQATGSFIDKDEPAKYIEYQGKKYFLDGNFCFKSGLLRFAVSVKRVNGAAAANGSDGNTMYAIGEKGNPTYIDSSKTNDAKSDCWGQKSP